MMFRIFTLVSLLSLGSAAFAQRVGEINPAEQGRYSTRYQAKSSTLIAFGPAWVNNLNNNDTLYNFALGHEWEVGAMGAVLIEANGTFGSSTHFEDALIGGKYFFSDEDFSPTLKAGFGFGEAKGSGLEDKSGFAGEIGAGITMFRTSSVHLELFLTYTTIFAKNESGQPGVTALNLGILF